MMMRFSAVWLTISAVLLCSFPTAMHAQTEGPIKLKKGLPPPAMKSPAPTSTSSSQPSDSSAQPTYSGSARELGMGPAGESDNGEGRPLFRRPGASESGTGEDGRPKLKRSSPAKSTDGGTAAQKQAESSSASTSSANASSTSSTSSTVETPVKENASTDDRPKLKRKTEQKPIEKPSQP